MAVKGCGGMKAEGVNRVTGGEIEIGGGGGGFKSCKKGKVVKGRWVGSLGRRPQASETKTTTHCFDRSSMVEVDGKRKKGDPQTVTLVELLSSPLILFTAFKVYC